MASSVNIHSDICHIKTYRKMADYIAHNLRIEDINGILLSQGIITHRTYQRISRKIVTDGPIAAGELFLSEALLRDPDPKSFHKFIAVLKNSNQDYLADQIMKEYERVGSLAQKQGPVVNSLADITTMDFTPEERQDLAAHRIINVMPLGESMTGKTTLLRTIIEERSSLASKCTSVASLHRWTPPQDPNVTALLYDVGGHKSYQNTAHLFQVNSEYTLNFLCHRIYAEDIKQWCEATLEWFDIMQISAPKSKTILVFTQVDRIEMAYIEDKIERVKQELKALFQKKQDMEKRHFQESDSVINRKLYQMHIQNCQDIIDQLKQDDESLNTIPRVSCLPGKEKSVDFIADLMLKFAENLKEEEGLAPTDLDLFKEIGTLGLKKDMILEDHVPAANETPSPEKQVTGTTERTESAEDKVPTHTVENPQKLRQQHITLTKVRGIFHPILIKHYPDKDPDLEKELQKSLENLKKKGLIRYFTERKKLAEIIFNDISTMVSILRCIFHHELSKFPKFLDLPRELRKAVKLTEKDYKKEVQFLTQHAIMSRGLVELLLKKSDCSLGGDIVLELLTTLNIAIPISDECNVAFVPYFLRDCKSDAVVHEEKKIINCYHTTLALHCVLKGQIPRPYFNELMVKLYGGIYQKCLTQKCNITWADGISVSLGSHDSNLMLIYNSTKKIIEFIIQANIEEIEGHRFLFDKVKFIDNESVSIRDARYEGLAIEFEFICTDCRRKDRNTKCVWDIQQCLDESEPKETTIKCEKGNVIPCALLKPLPKDEERAKYCHCKLLEHLKKHYPEAPTDAYSQPVVDIKKMDELKQYTREHSNKTQKELLKLCDVCHLKITKTTFGCQNVILTLDDVGRGFCTYLSDSIMPQPTRERINKAVTSNEALGIICDAFKASRDPTMLAQVLHVLRLKKTGKAEHADIIEQAYCEERKKYTPCQKCYTGGEQRQPEKGQLNTLPSGKCGPTKPQENTETSSQQERSTEIPHKRLKKE